MTSEVVSIDFPKENKLIPAADLRWTDRGRLVAIKTEAAVYVGHIDSVIFHGGGRVRVSLTRNGAEASVTLEPTAAITASDVWLEEKP